MHCGPSQIFRTETTFRRQHARFHQTVQRGTEQLKRIESAGSRFRRVSRALIRGRERESRAEQARFRLRESQVGSADGSQSRAGEFGGALTATNFPSSVSIATANAESAADRTASNNSRRFAKCRYAALGTTPARRVASRSTTASGPPARANSIPASSSARRRSPWR